MKGGRIMWRKHRENLEISEKSGQTLYSGVRLGNHLVLPKGTEKGLFSIREKV